MSHMLGPIRTESRRRTKRACQTCQRKKLKCDGTLPCATCVARSTSCSYGTASPTSVTHAEPANNRTHPYHVNTFNQTLEHRRIVSRDVTANGNITSQQSEAPESMIAGQPTRRGRPSTSHQNTANLSSTPSLSKRNGESGSSAPPGNDSNGSISGDPIQEVSRMLRDERGRLLYIGDSASLSYLHTVRRLVENTLGPSSFTNDPNRHKITEGTISTGVRPSHVLPDREAAEFLVDSFFSNTVGILQIFDVEVFTKDFATIYENPLKADQSRLCILNLVFAVGLQLTRSSAANSFIEGQILKRLDGGDISRAEMFYLNATHLNDPISGFEDGDITSVQSLLLITVYMLTISKRNAAWAYFGMAVRSAYALGLHINKTSFSLSAAEQHARNNIWRSMYVLDCFLSSSLGRPKAIGRQWAKDLINDGRHGTSSMAKDDTIESKALMASVRISQVTGDILSFVYSERKISVKSALQFSTQFQKWKDSLPATLHWQNISLPVDDSRITLAQLRVNLSYFHGIILLTRPFLLQKIINRTKATRKTTEDNSGQAQDSNSEFGSPAAEPFPGACVRSAAYSIDAINSALLKRALPRRDPFVIYWLFTAALIVLSNGFCTVYDEIDNNQAITSAITLMTYLGDVDPLAHRYLDIIKSFKDAIAEASISRPAPTTNIPTNGLLDAFFGRGSPCNDVQQRTPGTSNSQLLNNWQNLHPALQPEDNIAQMQGQPMIAIPGNRNASLQSIDLNGISPPDFSLDFDTFWTAVGLDNQGYPDEGWEQLYGTMDLSNFAG